LVYFDWAVSHLVLSVAGLVGRVFGVQPVQRRFTPADVHTKWWLGSSNIKDGKEA
jgi:hypothetical protein